MSNNSIYAGLSGGITVTELARRYTISTRRGAELTLLIAAWLLGVFAWILVDTSTGEKSLGGWTALEIGRAHV